MVTRLFQLLLFITPIAVCADVSLDIFDIVIFRTGAVALFMASLLDTPRRELPVYIRNLILGLFGLCLFNMFNFSLHATVMANVMNTFLAIISFIIIYKYHDTSKSLNKYIFAAALINLGFYISQKIGFDPIFNEVPSGGLVGAFLGNTARLATYFALLVPLLPIVFLPIMVLLSFLMGQYAIIPPVVVVAYNHFKTKRQRIVLAILCIAGVFIVRKHILTSISVRFTDAWAPVLTSFFDTPLKGCGLGINPVPNSSLGVILNSYIQFISGMGMLGAVWIGYMLREVCKRKVGIALICLLVLMLIEYPIELPRFWFLVMAILATSLINKEQTDV